MLVVRNLNMSRSSDDVNAVCSISGCSDSSFLNQVHSPPLLYHILLQLSEYAQQSLLLYYRHCKQLLHTLCSQELM